MQHSFSLAESQSNLLPSSFLGQNDHLFSLHRCSIKIFLYISKVFSSSPLLQPFYRHTIGCFPHFSLSCSDQTFMSQPHLFHMHSRTVDSVSMRLDEKTSRTQKRHGVSPCYCHPPTEQVVCAILITHHVHHLPGNWAAASAGKRKQILQPELLFLSLS